MTATDDTDAADAEISAWWTKQQDAHKKARAMRRTVRSLVRSGKLGPGKKPGFQNQIAQHFKVSRQRVHQVVVEERQSFADETDKLEYIP